MKSSVCGTATNPDTVAFQYQQYGILRIQGSILLFKMTETIPHFIWL